MIADFEGDISKIFAMEVEGEVPILATRNIVLFPGIIAPIIVGRKQSFNLVNKLKRNPDMTFAVFCQKNSEIEEPEEGDLCEYGTYAKLVRILDMPILGGNNLTIIVQALGRCRLEKFTAHHPYIIPEQYKGRFRKGPQPIQEPVGYSDLALQKFFAAASRMPFLVQDF